MKRFGFVLAGLSILIGLGYGNSFQNAWHFDDYPNIVDNANVHLTSLSCEEIRKSLQGIPEASMRRPVSYFTFALNYYIGKLDVFGYHVVNITIHYIAALILFLFLYEMLKLPVIREDYGRQAYAIALLATVLWVINPVQVSAVTYIVQRMSSLCALFYLLAMLFYMKARMTASVRSRFLYGGLCILSGLLSLGAKENGAMLPVSLFCLDLLIIQGVTRHSLKKNLIMVFSFLVILLFIGSFYTSIASIIGGYIDRPFTLEERLLTEPRVILFYISLLLYPTPDRLNMLHDIQISTSMFHPWTTMPALLCIIGMIVVALLLTKKKPLITFCIMFFFLNHLIEGSFVPLEIIYEHRNYLPSMFFFPLISIAIIYLFHRFTDRPVWQGILTLTLALVLIMQGMTVITRNEIFKDELSLWSDNVIKSPCLQRPHHNLGFTYLSLGRLSEGRDELLKALDAKDVSGNYNKTHTWFYLGQYYRMIGDDDEALAHFRKALDIASFNPEPHQAIAEIMLKRNDLVGAERSISKALSLNPTRGAYHVTYGAILLKKKWPDAAIAEAKRALQHRGDAGAAYSIMADAYAFKKDPVLADEYKKRSETEMNKRKNEPK